MADNAFQTAQGDIEAQRRAAVAAIAAGGSQGAQAFAQGQASIDTARAAALNQALSEAAQRGQGDLKGMLSSMVSQPYNQLGAGLTSSAASHAADTATRGASADNYFRQVGAAVPLASANLEAIIARAKAKAAASNQLSDSELRTRLMGAGELTRDEALGEAKGQHHLYQTQVEDYKAGLDDIRTKMMAVKSEQNRWEHGKSKANPHDLFQQRQLLQESRNALEMKLAQARNQRAPFTDAIRNPDSIENYARQAGIDAGEDPSRVLGLVRPAKPPKLPAQEQALNEAAQASGINDKLLQRILTPSTGKHPSHWENIQNNAENALQQNVSWNDFYHAMQKGLKGHSRTLKLATAYWAPIFQKNALGGRKMPTLGP